LLNSDGLAVKEMIAHYAKTGWESIPEDDVQRLKWYGLFLRNPTPGFFMIRVRIPGGKTGSYQLKALADIAGSYGNGILDLTTRQQLQLRQIRIEDVPAVFAKMDEVPIIRHPFDGAVLAHRRHHNTIAERHAAECRRGEKIDLGDFTIVIGTRWAAMACLLVSWLGL
jgi:sulfite reductase beta subunit-like hemoprotein